MWVFCLFWGVCLTLQWRHNERDGVSNHQRLLCLLNCSSRRRSKKTSKLRVTGHCAGNSPVTGEFPAQKASNVENVSIWWRHHDRPSVESSDPSAHMLVELLYWRWEQSCDCFTTSQVFQNDLASTHLPRTKWPPFRRRYFQMHFVNEKFYILIKILLKFIPKGPNDNNPALF